MTKASKKEYVNLQDDKIKEIISVLSTWDYTQMEFERLSPYLAQLLHDNYVSIESTCLIISEVMDISPIEDKIQEIYDGTNFPYLLNDLIEILSADEYDNLKKVIFNDKKTVPTSEFALDSRTKIVANFNTKQLLQIKESNKKNQEPQATIILEAVPQKLTVYDSSYIDLPRAFKIVWTSNYSTRNFTTEGSGVGATITEISQYLIDAGYSITNKLVKDGITAMINAMIYDGLAEIKTTIDNKGVYYNVEDDSVLPVKLDTSEPSIEEMVSAIELLEELHSFFGDNSDTFATAFKWGLLSVFSYGMKQAGNWLPWLYLKGTAGSGKTTLAKILLYLYGVPSVDNNISGSSFNTDYRFGEAISKDCTLRVVNEPKDVFKRASTNEMVKHCVEGLIARKIKGKIISAFSPVVFTANQYLPDDDALYRRFVVLGFSYNQRKSEEQKKDFERAFHINSPQISKLTSLSVFGRFAVREIFYDPSLLSQDWKETSDLILRRFFDKADCLMPSWLEQWAESETLDDFDDSQTEDIRRFFVDEFNRVRNKIDIRDEYGNKVHSTLDTTTSSDFTDFEDVNWGIVNNRMLNWALPHVSRWGNKSICLTRGLKKEMEKELDLNTDLKSIGELLGWEYKYVKFNGKPMKVLICDFSEFMQFLYPCGDVDD